MPSINSRGWLNKHPLVLIAPSPNHNERPKLTVIDLLVIHNISLPPGQFGGSYIIDFFQNQLDITSHPWFVNIANMQVSAHFLVRRTGQIIQFVSTLKRAWHAGVSSYDGKQACNDFSVGIELEGTDYLPYADIQYQSLIALTNAIRARHPIKAVQGHEHIAPVRKTDPGPAFDWIRYRQQAGLQNLNLPPL